jgi:hypothetical protein
MRAEAARRVPDQREGCLLRRGVAKHVELGDAQGAIPAVGLADDDGLCPADEPYR